MNEMLYYRFNGNAYDLQLEIKDDFNHRLLTFAHDRYSEPHRRYHNFAHISEMIIVGKQIFNITPVQYLAIIFHDIVYDPKNGFNEEDSVSVMRDYFKNDRKNHDWTISDKDIDVIANIILDTKGHFFPTCEQSRAVLDLDLWRMTLTFEEFQSHSKDIRREFDFVPEKAFLVGRRAFYLMMIATKPIFSTDYGRTNWEPKLRQNVNLALAVL